LASKDWLALFLESNLTVSFRKLKVTSCNRIKETDDVKGKGKVVPILLLKLSTTPRRRIGGVEV